MACNGNSPVCMVITEISIFVFLADVYSIDVYIEKSVVKQKRKTENES